MLDLLFGRPGALRKRASSSDEWTNMPGGFHPARMATQAGPTIDEDLALTYAAVWACTRLLAETIAMLPANVFERQGIDRAVADDLPAYDVIHNQPNSEMGAMPFREGRTMHQVNWGNGFAEIERNGFDQAVSMHPVHASRVRPATPGERAQGYRYRVINRDSADVKMRARDLLHMPGTLSEDGIWGKGVIQNARESIGFGLAIERHGATYFGSGAQPKAVVTLEGMRDKDTRRNYRAEWKEVHGSPDSSELAILPIGSTYTPMTISNEDSQFLETAKQRDIVVCQWYKVPPHLIGLAQEGTFSNIEQRGIEFVIYSLMPLLRRQEVEYNLKLLTPEERKRFYVEHNVAGLLRGDTKSRMDSYVLALQWGLMTINECRRLENLNSIGPAGDQHFVQLNMTTAERMLQEPTAAGAGASQANVLTAIADLRTLITAPAPPADVVSAGNQAQETPPPAAAATQQQPGLITMIREAIERMGRKEARAVARAIKHVDRDFESWLKIFHAKHRVTIAEVVAPTCQAFDTLTTPEEIATWSIDFAARELIAAYNHNTPAEMNEKLEKLWPTHLADAVIAKLIAQE